MKIIQDRALNTVVASGAQASEFKDRLGRVVGAAYKITAEVWTEAPADTTYGYMEIPSARCPAMTGAGTYYEAMTWNTRDGDRYQAWTTVMCASKEAAQRYCDAFMARKAKEAHKKAGK